MATLADVAQAARVSVSVVSRVLNDDPALRARDDTRERVRAAAARLGYTPNHAARTLRLSRAGTIALVLPDIGNPIVAETMRGAEDRANDTELHVLLGRSERLREGGAELQRIVADRRVDGFLVQLDDDANVREFERVVKPSTPMILLHARGRQNPSVVLDDEAGAALATAHLVDLGHTAIGFIGGLPASQTGKRREKGFRTTMGEVGLPRPREWITARGYGAPAGGRAVDDILDAVRRPTGVVVANVNAAFGVMRRLGERGVRVPDELSVVAIHDSWFAEYLTPAITTVRMPLYELGREGVRLLTARMAGGRPENHVVVDPRPRLVLRESTAPPVAGRRRGPVRTWR